jgi:hypothetical protein
MTLQWLSRLFVANQRMAKHSNKLSAEHEAQLNAIGLTWRKSRREMLPDWDVRSNQLVEYKMANGDFNVGTNPVPNVELGRWIAKLRHLWKKKQMSEEREAKLNAIGFVWNSNSRRVASDEYTSWNTQLEDLLEHKKVNGDCNVSSILLSQNDKLRRWIVAQRGFKNKSQLSKEGEANLNSIGFDWHPTRIVVSDEHSNWGTRFEQLLAYKLEFADCTVPQRFNRNLLKLRYNANKMTVERVVKLNSIGFDWRKQARLIACNQQREKYKRTHHAEPCDDVPDTRHSKANPSHIGKSVTEQFSIHKRRF